MSTREAFGRKASRETVDARLRMRDENWMLERGTILDRNKVLFTARGK